jgi:mannose-6-phosphate isomerase-like protein (cupin superfamily)
MNCNCYVNQGDNGPRPVVADVAKMAVANQSYRRALWTGENMQMTLMSIPVCGDIGLEVHDHTEQIIRIEQGNAVVTMGPTENQITIRQNLCPGDVCFVPAGTWHDVINTGNTELKLSSIYAPPNHPRGTLQYTKAQAEREET